MLLDGEAQGEQRCIASLRFLGERGSKFRIPSPPQVPRHAVPHHRIPLVCKNQGCGACAGMPTHLDTVCLAFQPLAGRYTVSHLNNDWKRSADSTDSSQRPCIGGWPRPETASIAALDTRLIPVRFYSYTETSFDYLIAIIHSSFAHYLIHMNRRDSSSFPHPCALRMRAVGFFFADTGIRLAYVQPPALLEIARPARPSPEARRNVGGIRAQPEPFASFPLSLNVIHTTARHRCSRHACH